MGLAFRRLYGSQIQAKEKQMTKHINQNVQAGDTVTVNTDIYNPHTGAQVMQAGVLYKLETWGMCGVGNNLKIVPSINGLDIMFEADPDGFGVPHDFTQYMIKVEGGRKPYPKYVKFATNGTILFCKDADTGIVVKVGRNSATKVGNPLTPKVHTPYTEDVELVGLPNE